MKMNVKRGCWLAVFWSACVGMGVLLGTLQARASVVEVVNSTTSVMRFVSTGAPQPVDMLVPANGSRRWVVPDIEGGDAAIYVVDAIPPGGAPTALGNLTVASEAYYLGLYETTGGLTVTQRTYDASQVFGAGGYSKASLVGWVRNGMLLQFGVEVAALCFLAFRVARARGAHLPAE